MRHSFLTPTIAALVACAPMPLLKAQDAPLAAAADVAPTPTLAYQGRLMEGAAAANGARVFAFSILDSAGVEQWASGNLTLTVNEGLYAVVLGATGMPALPVTLLGKAGLKLHVKLSGLALTPDIDIVPAFQARSAWEVTGPFAGDVTGTQNTTLVMKLQGTPLDLTTNAPSNGQALVFLGGKWVPSSVVGTAGATGPQGPSGPAGPTGATGPTGASGVAGTAGAQGPAGVTGAIGLTGAAGPGGPAGVTGATGPQGPIGVTGPKGAQGNDGQVLIAGNASLSGGTDPASNVGGEGDFYVNTSTNMIFGPKTNGAWPAGSVSMVGPQGSVGTQGIQG
ncbi:MAG: hypothetical protein WCO20_07300, partial [Holophagaceae bacterium]